MKFLFLCFLLSAPAFADSCQEIRGALDIGSGTTKALAALVDVCKKEIVRVVYESQVPIAFSEAVEKTADQKFTPALIDEAAPKIQALVAGMQEKKAGHILALATSVFRTAANGAEAAATLSARIGVPVRVVSQEEESELGYLSALAAHKVPLNAQDNIVVWDIGGGSMQIRAETGGETQVYKGELAATTFKNRVLKEVEKKDPQVESSPNPLGKSWRAAVKLAQEEAANVPAYFKLKMSPKQNPKRWLGIGGVLALSVQNQVKKKGHSFTAAEVETLLKKRAALTDEQIGGEYHLTEVTNLALVLGYMKALGIKKVETAPASLNQGHLLLQLFNPLRDTTPAPASPGLVSTAPARP